MRDDDARKVILARRARFVAAAMMGTGLMSCKTTEVPTCLSPVQVQDDPPPQPCLSVGPVLLPPGMADGTGDRADAGATADRADAGATDAGAGPPPMPCLSPMPPPQPCLKVRPSVCLTK